MYGQQYPPVNSLQYPQQSYGQQSYPAAGQSSYFNNNSQQYPQNSYGGTQQQPYGQQSYPPQGQSSYPNMGQQSYPQAGQSNYNNGNQAYGQQQAPGNRPPGYPATSQPYGQQPYGQQQQSQSYGQQQGYGMQSFGGPAQPIVGNQYCKQQEQVFFLEESVMSLSGDDFKITDSVNPANHYKLDSAALSMKGSRVLKDSSGRAVLSMHHKALSNKLWYISRGSNKKDEVAEVKAAPSGVMGGGRPTACDIYLKGNTSHHFSNPRPDFHGQGDVRGKSFQIYRGQQPVAEISRKLAYESSKQRMTGKDSYALKVFPGTDAVFMIAICLIIDELFHD